MHQGKLNKDQVIRVFDNIGKLVLETQKSAKSDPAFQKPAMLETLEQQGTRELAAIKKSEEIKGALRKGILKEVQTLMEEMQLGKVIEPTAPKQAWEIEGLKDFNKENPAVRKALKESLAKTTFQHLQSEQLEAATEEVVNKIFSKADFAIQRFQKLDKEIENTANYIITTAQKNIAIRDEQMMALVFGLAATAVGVVTLCAAISILVASTPATMGIGAFLITASGANLGGISAIAGSATLIYAACMQCELMCQDSKDITIAASALPKFYRTEMDDLMTCLNDFHKLLPTQKAAREQAAEVGGVVKYVEKIDKEAEKGQQEIGK